MKYFALHFQFLGLIPDQCHCVLRSKVQCADEVLLANKNPETWQNTYTKALTNTFLSWLSNKRGFSDSQSGGHLLLSQRSQRGGNCVFLFVMSVQTQTDNGLDWISNPEFKCLLLTFLHLLKEMWFSRNLRVTCLI